MDPLSDVLSLLRPRSYVCGGFDIGEGVSIAFPKHSGVKCYALASGEAWLSVEGVAEPARLKAGDCFLLPLGRPFRLGPDLTPPSLDFRPILADRPNGAIAEVAGGGACLLLGGHFALDGKHAEFLLDVLPPIVHIRAEADRASLRWSLERMRQEMSEPRPGGLLVIQHIAQMMLVQALRLHMAEGPRRGVGWLFALADRQMGVVIGAMHADPARRWTVQTLAELAGMSRSSFATRFRQTVGAAPMDYLTRWRMLLAGGRLTESDDPVSVIALSLGYESENAFSTAFKRVMGRSPRRYGRAAPARSALDDRKKEKASRGWLGGGVADTLRG